MVTAWPKMRWPLPIHLIASHTAHEGAVTSTYSRAGRRSIAHEEIWQKILCLGFPFHGDLFVKTIFHGHTSSASCVHIYLHSHRFFRHFGSRSVRDSRGREIFLADPVEQVWLPGRQTAGLGAAGTQASKWHYHKNAPLARRE